MASYSYTGEVPKRSPSSGQGGRLPRVPCLPELRKSPPPFPRTVVPRPRSSTEEYSAFYVPPAPRAVAAAAPPADAPHWPDNPSSTSRRLGGSLFYCRLLLSYRERRRGPPTTRRRSLVHRRPAQPTRGSAPSCSAGEHFRAPSATSGDQLCFCRAPSAPFSLRGNRPSSRGFAACGGGIFLLRSASDHELGRLRRWLLLGRSLHVQRVGLGRYFLWPFHDY